MLKRLLLVAAIVYTIVLVVVSLIDLDGIPNLGSSFDDKIYHFLAYFVLGYLWVSYFRLYNANTRIIKIISLLLAFGVFLELIQHQINPNRTLDGFDALSNCLGVIVGTIVAKHYNIFELNIFKALFILLLIN